MEHEILKKMKVKPEYSSKIINPPEGYPSDALYFGDGQEDTNTFDFVHLFIESKEQFKEFFQQARKSCKPGNLFWLSYPKSKGKIKYDINRDILWDLVAPEGYHPVAMVSLDDKWSAIRLSENEEGVIYQRPNKK